MNNTKLIGLNASLKKEELDSLLVSSVSNIFYLTEYGGFSKEEREAFALITPKRNYILTDGRYVNEVSNISGFSIIEVSSKNSFSEALKKIVRENKLKVTGFEASDLSILEYSKIKTSFQKIKPADSLLLAQRAIKTKNEILNIKKACLVGDLTFKYIVSQIKEGISEKELATKIEMFIKQNGGDISFVPIVAFGKNSATPHHQNTNEKLKKPSIILLDFGAKINGYCSDMTRSVFFGKASDEHKRIYQTVLEAQNKAVEFIKSTVKSHKLTKTKDVDAVARASIINSEFETIPHSLGHGIGIDVHEVPHLSPNSRETLKSGMVFSIEPGIYLSKTGGIRIEDLFFLDKNGLEKITHSPNNIIEL